MPALARLSTHVIHAAALLRTGPYLGDSKDEEVFYFNDTGNAIEQCHGVRYLRLVASRTVLPTMSRAGNVFSSDGEQWLRTLRRCADYNVLTRSGDILAFDHGPHTVTFVALKRAKTCRINVVHHVPVVYDRMQPAVMN
jgi:hypothetical protein